MSLDTFANYAAIVGLPVSLVSLVVSLVVLSQVSELKKAYLFAVRVPDLIERLKKQTSRVSVHLSSFPSSNDEVVVTLALASGTLKSLAAKLPKTQRTSIIGLIEMTGAYNPADGVSGLRNIYGTMLRVVQELEDLQKDRQWENLK